MIDSLSVPVPSFNSLLILGGIFLLLVYFDSRLKVAQTWELRAKQESKSETSAWKTSLEIEALRTECLQLREALQKQGVEVENELQETVFQKLQTLLTNYPSVRQLVDAKPELPAKNIISLFTSLDNLIESWGYESIGKVWEKVSYNPQLHQADLSDIEVGELVYVRFVGYRKGDHILTPAKVSRTLPAGIKN
ncbi:MAG: molecular chaperone GrpE [Coleofasciculaceae cyanobacterium]